MVYLLLFYRDLLLFMKQLVEVEADVENQEQDQMVYVALVEVVQHIKE